jgi:hypothetical protein
MDLTSPSLTVVNTDSLYFGISSAYLVDLSGVKIEDFCSSSNSYRASFALEKGQSLDWILEQGLPPFVSKHLMYEIQGWIFNKSKPTFRYMVPVCSGRCHMVDCWIVDADGDRHPDYDAAGVPVATRDFVAVDNSPRVMG